jgi:hypothetical protein
MYDTHEEKELAIDTTAGLQSFLEYVNDAYTELTELIQESTVFGHDLSKETNIAYEIYEELIESVARYEMVLERGGLIRNEDVLALQALYSELVTIIDNLPAPVHTPPVVEARVTEQPVKPLTIQSTESVPEVFSETSKTLNDLLVAAGKLVEKGDVLLHKYEEIKDAPETTEALNIPKFYYAQLGVSAARAKKIKDEIFTLSQERDNNRAEPLLQHFKDILEEIDKNYEQLDKGLDGYFEPELPAVAETTAPVGTISHTLPTHIPSDDFSHGDERITDLSPYTKRALASSELRTAASQKYRTRAQLEAALKREIYRVEAPSKLDTVLGITHASCFYTFLHDMTVEAIAQFDALPRESIREALQKRDIPYEIYINWTDIFYDIVEIMQPPKNMKFGELYVRAELELLVEDKNAGSSQ